MPTRLPPFENDITCASTLPAFAYTDAAILAAERTSIFRRTWQPIGRVADVRAAGTFFTAAIDDAPIVVTRDGSGILRAFHNVCRHRAGPVAVGNGARKSLTCKYHGWTYALDGKLVTTPELGEVKNFEKACHGLRPVQVATFGPIVFANLDPDAEPLRRGRRELGTLRAREARRTRKRASRECRWLRSRKGDSEPRFL
jgi:choline monooxygenase